MRVTAAFSRLLRLPGADVRNVAFDEAKVVVTVALRRRRLLCPDCDFSTSSRYDRRPAASSWRHLDLGVWRLEVKAELRRLSCPAHGSWTTASTPTASRGCSRSGWTRSGGASATT